MSAAIAYEPLTRSVEDYLKAIYRLSLKGHPATTSDIAQLLELAAPSVSGMIKRLSEQGLLEHEPYKGVQLTAEGRRVALRILRRHRVLEAYLVAFLGYGWEHVHEEAERLEHAVSEVLIERMASALGDPHFDPHGDPIPGPDGSIAELVYTPLGDIPVGETVEVRQADTNQPDKLRYIATFGLTPGAKATVLNRQPFQGPITIEVNGERHVLGGEIARLLLCARPGVAQ
jgi:DtxR family transcriptional regulator, Mn-dependent transcriptional regulator